MKRLLAILTGLLLLLSVDGQILRYSNYTAPPEHELRGPDELWDGHTVIWLEHDTLLSESSGAVSAWEDIVNGHELIPYADDGSSGTADNYPSWTKAGGVVFDGTDDVLKCVVSGWTSFGTVYAVVKQNSWSNDDVLFGYSGTGAVRVSQRSSTPNIAIAKSSSTVGGLSFTLGEVGILVLHTNETTPISTLSLNGGEPIENTGSMVGYTSGGVILGAAHAKAPALQRYANVTIYAIIYRDQIDSGATLTAIYDYLNTKY